MSTRSNYTIRYEVNRLLEDDRWYYYTSDWDFHIDTGHLPTSDELSAMLEDWLNDNDETEGTWSLTAYNFEVALVSGVVDL